jgi:hypothetical protein
MSGRNWRTSGFPPTLPCEERPGTFGSASIRWGTLSAAWRRVSACRRYSSASMTANVARLSLDQSKNCLQPANVGKTTSPFVLSAPAEFRRRREDGGSCAGVRRWRTRASCSGSSSTTRRRPRAQFVALIQSFIATIVSGLHQPIDARCKSRRSSSARSMPRSHEYLYLGCQPAAPSGMRSKKCQTLQKSSPGENGASDTRTIPPFWLRNTETPGIQPPSWR